jgi:excisionase family DNA binding protein
MQTMDIASLSPSPPKAEPLAVAPAEAARLAGLGRTTIYAALGSGALKSLKIGKRRLIALDALRSSALPRGHTVSELPLTMAAEIAAALEGRPKVANGGAAVRSTAGESIGP